MFGTADPIVRAAQAGASAPRPPGVVDALAEIALDGAVVGAETRLIANRRRTARRDSRAQILLEPKGN